MAFILSPPLPFSRPPSKFHLPRRSPPTASNQPAKSSAVTPPMLREYERYIRDVVKSPRPDYLDGLLHILTTVQKQAPVQPAARTNLHPFFVPLTSATDPSGVTSHTGLLRWPTPPENMPMPVVSARSDDLSLTLLAPSVKRYVTRAIAAADFSGRKEVVDGIRKGTALALGYQDGEVDESGLGLERYLLLKTGPFPDIYESLARFHFAKGDTQSCLVTCEKAAVTFPGWGRAHVFHAGILQEMSRESEAKDAARFALQMPLWTLGAGGVGKMKRLAGYVEEESLGRIYKRLFEDKREKDVAEGKPIEQVALDRAAFLLDLCVVEGGEWEGVRMSLAELYDEGGMNDFATFVRY